MQPTLDHLLRWHDWSRRTRLLAPIVATATLVALLSVAAEGYLAAHRGKLAKMQVTQHPEPEGASAAVAATALPRAEVRIASATEAPPFSLDAAERDCLASTIYHEARGEPADGQIAVAQVVVNRVRSGRWPASICAVVNQGASRGEKCQFSFACRKSASRPRPGEPDWDNALALADAVASGQAELPALSRATHYHTIDVRPVWRLALRPLVTIGRHTFYADVEDSRAPRGGERQPPAEAVAEPPAIPRHKPKSQPPRHRKAAAASPASRGGAGAGLSAASLLSIERN